MVTVVFACLLFISPFSLTASDHLAPQTFVQRFIAGDIKPEMIWLKKAEQAAAKKILGHRYRGLRLRYWRDGPTTAWIMNEIGKDRPITIGIVIEQDQIKAVRILTYREPRGGEVRHPFFTQQYEGLSLSDDDKLSDHIDGISGATLSVRAVTNISRYALYLNKRIAPSKLP